MERSILSVGIMLLIFIFPSISSSQGNKLSVVEIETNPEFWNRYLLGFRKAHNFGGYCGASSGVLESDKIEGLPSIQQAENGYFCKGQYSFHLRIAQSFGYFLGSSLGYHFVENRKEAKLKVPSSWQFPSVLLGLVWNPKSTVRCFTSIDFYLERFDGVRPRESNDIEELAFTGNAYEASLGVDLFYSLKWAVRFTYHTRFVQVQPPEDIGENRNLPIEAGFKKSDRWTSIGLVLHLI